MEDLGYSTLLLPDHFIEQIATMPGLAMAAAVTSRLRVGSIVCGNDFRHLILLAKESATIDMLSDGRFELGIGAGWLKAEYDSIGVTWDAPGDRIDRLEEAVHLIKSYFSGEPFDVSGRFYTARSGGGLDLMPRPVQKPHPPIMIGAGGRRLLGLAAREADIVSIALRTKADGTGPDVGDIGTLFSEKVDWVRESAGERFDEIELNVQTWAVAVTDDRESAARQLQAQFPLPLDTLLDLPYLLIGDVDSIVDQVVAHRERYGLSYFAVFDHHMHDFAPVVARLTGT